MKIAIIFNDQKWSGRLTKLFTGCYAYHTAWVDEERGFMYDMHWLRRRRLWPYYKSGEVLLFNVPQMTAEFQEHKLSTDRATYGVLDYLLFGFRWAYHLVGKSTRNVGGVICSEMIVNDLREVGVEVPWKSYDPPPSPCDLYRWLSKQ